MFLKKVMITGAALVIFPHLAGATELRAYRYTYDHGDVAKSSSPDNQHIICDACPQAQPLAKAVREIAFAPAIPPTANRPPLEEWAEKKDKYDVGVVSHRVFFKFDSAVVSKSETIGLNSFLGTFLKPDRKAVTTVTGYTCDIGTTAYNTRLSKRRAKAIEKKALALGYSGIKIDWKGILPTTKHGRAVNRRGDVVITVR